MAGSILGTRVLRTEDPELLVGAARYVDDLDLDGRLHVVFVRSEMPHALVTGVDTAAAAEAPGVVGVFTAADLGIAPFQGMAKVDDDFARPALATDRVRFVGEPIVAVVADTFTNAFDAAAMVTVDYEPLPAAITAEEALADGAPVLFEAHGDNVAISTTDAAKPDLFADADVIVRGRYVNQRMAVAPIEPHGEAATVDADGRLVVYCSTQMPHLFLQLLAKALDMAPEELRIITPLVGGGFGGKAGLYAEQVVVAALAKRLQRPVSWMSTRTEDMVALHHSRGQIQ
ncbi:MAG TPA: molybdopterin cofactor-binding domain-containing protein, partial [Ilumatobacteraceae bacterium]